MTKRARTLVIGAVAALAVAAVAFVVMGQTGATSVTPRRDAFLEKVAAHLGVKVEDLVVAFEKARLEQIDEAVAAGKITPEQAEALKARLEARKALREVLDEGLASGKITQEQLDLLRERLNARRGGLFQGPGVRGRLLQRFTERRCR